MGGDHAAGGDPEDLPEAHSLGQSLGRAADGIAESLGVDEDQDLPGEAVLLREFLQQLQSHLLHFAPVFFRGLQMAVQQLDQGIQGQDLCAQVRGVADPAACPEVAEVPGEEAHFHTAAQFPGFFEDPGQGCIGIGFHIAGQQEDDQALTGRDVPSVEAGDPLPALCGDDGALVGAGGHSRVGQVEDGLAGIFPLEPVKDRLKVAHGGAAGLGQGAGAFKEAVDVRGGEGAVIPGLVAEGHMHGHGLDAIALRQVGGDVGACFGKKDIVVHRINLDLER